MCTDVTDRVPSEHVSSRCLMQIYKRLGLAPQSILSQKMHQVCLTLKTILFGKPRSPTSDGGKLNSPPDMRSHSVFTHESLRKDVLQARR